VVRSPLRPIGGCGIRSARSEVIPQPCLRPSSLPGISLPRPLEARSVGSREIFELREVAGDVVSGNHDHVVKLGWIEPRPDDLRLPAANGGGDQPVELALRRRAGKLSLDFEPDILVAVLASVGPEPAGRQRLAAFGDHAVVEPCHAPSLGGDRSPASARGRTRSAARRVVHFSLPILAQYWAAGVIPSFRFEF
jgi:hypothetical protein